MADRGESHYVFPAPLDRIPTAVDADHSPHARQGEAGSGDGAHTSAAVDASGRVTPAEGFVAAGSKGAAGGVAAVAGTLPSAEAYHNALYAPVLRWVRGVIDGTMPPTLRSEEPPLDNLAPVPRALSGRRARRTRTMPNSRHPSGRTHRRAAPIPPLSPSVPSCATYTHPPVLAPPMAGGPPGRVDH